MTSDFTPALKSVKANDSAVTKAKKDLAIVGLFGASITVTIRKVRVGATVPLGKMIVMCQRRTHQRLHSRKKVPSAEHRPGPFASYGSWWGETSRKAKDHLIQQAFYSLPHVSLAIQIMDSGVRKVFLQLSVFTFMQLSNFTVTFHFHALEKEMATHSSVLA